MCTVTIIDTNVLWKIAPASNKEQRRDIELCSWISQGHATLVYSRRGKYFREISHSPRIGRLFNEYRRAQRAKLITESKLKIAEEKLRNTSIRSNDKHILELALASDALLLCSNDKKLKVDFVDHNLIPKVGGKSRVVYPIDESPETRKSFLQERRCPNRKIN